MLQQYYFTGQNILPSCLLGVRWLIRDDIVDGHSTFLRNVAAELIQDLLFALIMVSSLLLSGSSLF